MTTQTSEAVEYCLCEKEGRDIILKRNKYYCLGCKKELQNSYTPISTYTKYRLLRTSEKKYQKKMKFEQKKFRPFGGVQLNG